MELEQAKTEIVIASKIHTVSSLKAPNKMAVSLKINPSACSLPPFPRVFVIVVDAVVVVRGFADGLIPFPVLIFSFSCLLSFFSPVIFVV